MRVPCSMASDASWQIRSSADRRPLAPVGHAIEPGEHLGLQARAGPVVVDVDDLGEFVVVDDRERQRQLAAALRSGFEQVGFGPDRRRHRGDDLFADRVQRRVGHLGEQLLEVVEQQTRTLGQHGERGVGAHRAERLSPAGRHRGDEDLQFLVGVAEHLLASQHAVVAEHDVFTCGQVGQRRPFPAPATRRTGAVRRART